MNHNLHELTVQLIDNLSSRIEQLYSLSNIDDQELKKRFVFLLEDMGTLLRSIESLEKDIDINEINFLLKSMLENLKNDEFYLLKDVLQFEFNPILHHWRGILGNEKH